MSPLRNFYMNNHQHERGFITECPYIMTVASFFIRYRTMDLIAYKLIFVGYGYVFLNISPECKLFLFAKKPEKL